MIDDILLSIFEILQFLFSCIYNEYKTHYICVYYGKISSELALSIGLQQVKGFFFIKFVDKPATIYINDDT